MRPEIRRLTCRVHLVAAAALLAGCDGSRVDDRSQDADAPFDATIVVRAMADAGVPPLPELISDVSVVTLVDASSDDESSPPGDGLPEAASSVGPPQSGPFLDGSCPYDASFSPDAGSSDDDASDAHVPDQHRPAGECCPVARDPGQTCDPDAAFPPVACFSDSDCVKGTNGRCLAYPASHPVNPSEGGVFALPYGCSSECTYDECFSDVDCPGHVPCDCRASPYGTNVCRKGSNCSVDSDCGPGGFCSPDPWTSIYYCHGPGDVCFNHRDCPSSDFGDLCRFDTAHGKWACFPNPPPP